VTGGAAAAILLPSLAPPGRFQRTLDAILQVADRQIGTQW
jgi:hypothetical protein